MSQQQEQNNAECMTGMSYKGNSVEYIRFVYILFLLQNHKNIVPSPE